MKKYFDSTLIDDLKKRENQILFFFFDETTNFLQRKLSDRFGSKSQAYQQQRAQYENQLSNIYSSRHEHRLETIYFNILEKQFTSENHLGLKQQIILQSLIQHRDFQQLIDRTNERKTLIKN